MFYLYKEIQNMEKAFILTSRICMCIDKHQLFLQQMIETVLMIKLKKQMCMNCSLVLKCT